MRSIAVLRWIRRKYPRLVGIARRPEERIRPVPRQESLDRWVNCWVATKGDEVIAAAPTSREIAAKLLEMGDAGRGAVIQFVHPDTDAYVVGAG
jgi:hypothetical protein